MLQLCHGMLKNDIWFTLNSIYTYGKQLDFLLLLLIPSMLDQRNQKMHDRVVLFTQMMT